MAITIHFACSTAKSSTDTGLSSGIKVQIVKADKSIKGDTIPKTQKDKTLSEVDTIQWVKDTIFQPIRLKKLPLNNKKIGRNGNNFLIKLFIPLNSDGLTEQQASVADNVHFYAGMLMAAEELISKGIGLTIDVTDTEEGKFDIQKAVEATEFEMPDVLIGPFEREDLRIMAERALQLQIPLFSPWQTSTKIAVENPYYIQLKPNLKAHYQKIASHVFNNYHRQEVAIVGRNNNEFNSWVSYYEELANQKGLKQSGDYFIKYYVNNDSLISGPSAFTRLLSNTKLKAVILPNFSYNDELFVYNCIRKLSVEKGSRQLTAYGMPLLYLNDRIEYDHYASLGMRLVVSDFVDDTNLNVRNFRKRFLEAFGEIALPSAIRGYDVMSLIGELLINSGNDILNIIDKESFQALQYKFEIVKVRADEQAVTPENNQFDFYENQVLNIIEFSDSKFRKID